MNTEGLNSAKRIEKNAADLYWLAFLLTRDRSVSIDIAADVAASGNNENPFFADWKRNWARRLVIARALSTIHDELAESARRTELAHFRRSEVPRNWSLSPDVTRGDLEQALLAIDWFPRAAVVLLVLEGVRTADAVPLLDARPSLLKKAQAIGLSELAGNLAKTGKSAVSPAVHRNWQLLRLTAEFPGKLFDSQ